MLPDRQKRGRIHAARQGSRKAEYMLPDRSKRDRRHAARQVYIYKRGRRHAARQAGERQKTCCQTGRREAEGMLPDR